MKILNDWLLQKVYLLTLMLFYPLSGVGSQVFQDMEEAPSPMRTTTKKGTSRDGKPVQYNTIKVRLHPTAAQAELFEKTFGCCRYIWNRMLADQERFYLETGTHFIPTPAKYKKEAPFLTEVDNQALTQEYNHLAQAFRSFFRDPATFGHPNFKRKKDRRDSFTACNQFSPSGSTIDTTRDALRMTKAGLVKAAFSRRPRSGWRLTRVTVERTRTGKYFACLLYECPVRPPEPVLPTEETALGLKYSLSHFYVIHTGLTADPPRWLKDSQEKLAGIQSRLSRMQPGSRNYQELVRKYRLLHEHIANQRKDFLHKESRRIANGWDAVCLRSDSLTEMAGAVDGSIQSTGFGMFRELLRYKLERQGKSLIAVDRYLPTTKTCSSCGSIHEELAPRDKRWTCEACGTTHDREVNAARNIRGAGLSQFYAALPRAALT